MEEACAIAEAVLEVAVQAIRPGVRETDVVAAAMHELYRLGGELSHVTTPFVASGEHMAPPNRIPSDKIIRNGDVVFIDIGAHVVGLLRRYRPDGDLRQAEPPPARGLHRRLRGSGRRDRGDARRQRRTTRSRSPSARLPRPAASPRTSSACSSATASASAPTSRRTSARTSPAPRPSRCRKE